MISDLEDIQTLFEEIIYLLEKDGEEISFTCLNVGVTLKTDVKTFIEWSKYYFEGYFKWSVINCFNTKVYATSRNKYLDIVCERISIDYRNLDDTGTVVLKINNHIDLVYQKDPAEKKAFSYYILDKSNNRILILVPMNHPEAKYIPMRIVRASIIFLLAGKGWFYFHSACLVNNGLGIGIIGEKFTGKTTCMMNLIQGNTYDFLANDKVALREENGIVNIMGFPIAVGIRVGTIFSFSSLKSWFFNNNTFQHSMPDKQKLLNYSNYIISELKNIDEKVFFLPKEISFQFNISIVSSAVLKLFIVTRYDPQIKRAKIVKISEEEVKKVLEKEYLDSLCPKQKFIESIVNINKKHLRERFNAFVEDNYKLIPFYRLFQNERTNSQSLSLIKRIFKNL